MLLFFLKKKDLC